MPQFDGKGPQGLGPTTGRGQGPCVSGARRGYGRSCCRRGFGGEQGYGTVQLDSKEQESILAAELNELEQEKAAILERLKKIEDS